MTKEEFIKRAQEKFKDRFTFILKKIKRSFLKIEKEKNTEIMVEKIPQEGKFFNLILILILLKNDLQLEKYKGN